MNNAWIALIVALIGMAGSLIVGYISARSTLKVANISQDSTLKVANISQDREDQRVRREELKKSIIDFYDVALETYRQESEKAKRIRKGIDSQLDMSEAERKNSELRQINIDLVFVKDRLLIFHDKLGAKAEDLSKASKISKRLQIEDDGDNYKMLMKAFLDARTDFIEEVREVLGIK